MPLRTVPRIILVGSIVSSLCGGSANTLQAQDVNFNELNQKAISLFNKGRYRSALPLAIKALELAEKKYAPNQHANVAALSGNLAGVYLAMGQYQKAAIFYNRSLKINEKVMGPDHPDTAISLNNLAESYRKQGKFKSAIPLMERAITIAKNKLGPKHRNLGSYYNNLAVNYEMVGDYIRAEPMFKLALDIRQSLYGNEHRDIATTLNNLGNLYLKYGRYEEADAIFKKSHAMRLKILGPKHPHVATSLNNLGMVSVKLNRLDQAEDYYKRARTIFSSTHLTSHPDVATTINNLAHVYWLKKNDVEAEKLFKASLVIRKLIFKNGHPGIALGMNNLAEFYRKKQRYSEAEPLYKEALIAMKGINGQQTTDVVTIQTNLAVTYTKLGRHQDAEENFKQSLKIHEALLGPNHPDVGTILHHMANLYTVMNRNADLKAIKKRLAEMPTPGTRHISLFLATNRNPLDQNGFGTEISKSLSLGKVIMQVPSDAVRNRAKRLSDSLGQLENAVTGDLTGADKLNVVRVNKIETAETFASQIQQNLKRAAIFKNQVLIFVHGYNTSFDGAMKRATQLAFDLQFDGIVIPFTWPSQSSLAGYLTDRNHAMTSVDTLIGFLDSLQRSMPGTKIHLLAHSMGNQVMLNALCKIAQRKPATQHNLGQVISAHADVSQEDFESLTKCFRSRVKGTTLYVNENDTALRVRCGGFRCRAGNRARNYSASDVIDTTQLGKGTFGSLTDGLDHDVFVRNPLLFSDITRLLLTGERPVENRTHEFEPKKDSNGGIYWAYEKGRDPAARPIAAANHKEH